MNQQRSCGDERNVKPFLYEVEVEVGRRYLLYNQLLTLHTYKRLWKNTEMNHLTIIYLPTSLIKNRFVSQKNNNFHLVSHHTPFEGKNNRIDITLKKKQVYMFDKVLIEQENKARDGLYAKSKLL